MEQEYKELLLKDLCARSPYGVIVSPIDCGKAKLIGFKNDDPILFDLVSQKEYDKPWRIEYIKPYLRPMSSMTDEEKKQYQSLCELHFDHDADDNTTYCYFDTAESFDWLNAHHFDYRDLIEKGLAISTEIFNPYAELLNSIDSLEEEPDCIYNHVPKNHQITIGTKIRLKANPDVILSIISDDCHEDKFECSNGSVLSLKQIEKYYDIHIEENK